MLISPDYLELQKALHAGGSKMAGSMVGSVESVTTSQLKLKKLGLLPKGQFTDIARSTVSLATEGFFEGVEAGDIAAGTRQRGGCRAP